MNKNFRENTLFLTADNRVLRYSKLYYIKEQTPEVCMYEINEDPLSFKFLREQTNELAVFAVRRNSYILRYVKNKTHEVIEAYNLKFIKNECRYK